MALRLGDRLDPGLHFRSDSMSKTSGRESTLATAVPLLAGLASFIPAVRGDEVVDRVPPWPRSEIPVPAGAENPCAGIRLRNYERIEAQGFLGLLTPSAEWEVVRDALDDNLSVAWKSHRLRHSPIHGEGGIDSEPLRLGIDHHIRPRSGFELLAFEFRLFEVCREAARRGVRSLTFACDVDTVEYSVDDERTSAREPAQFGNPIRRREPEPLDHGYALTLCFLSTAGASSPSWEELLAARWGDDARSEEFAGSNRHELIEVRDFRRLQYFGLIREVVNRLAASFGGGSPAGTRAQVTAGTRAQVTAGTRDGCRIDDSTQADFAPTGLAASSFQGRTGR